VENQNRLLDIKTVRLNKLGLTVRHAELGDSTQPPLLLFHGVPENLQGWYDVAPLIAEKYHVLALDWTGLGGSDPLTSTEDYNSLRFAEMIVDFSAVILTAECLRMGAIGTIPVAFLGQSFALPVLFGFLSQAIAYQRASKLITEYKIREYNR